MKRLHVLTSGGDAPGMNTALAAMVKVAAAHGVQVLGVEDGYDGLIDGRARVLEPAAVQDVWSRGGTMLGTARSDRFRSPEGRAKAAAVLAGDGLCVIGGNGSLTGALLLAQEHGARVVGVPASIDNDLAVTTTSIGVDTALNTIVEACDRLGDTARSHRRAFLVEVMGRHCGYLAMASAIGAQADGVLVPESRENDDAVVDRAREVLRTAFHKGKRRVLLLKAEGVALPTDELARRLRVHLPDDAPGAELRTTVLGHVVRGGPPTFRDRLVAARLAHGAVWGLLHGHSGVMTTWEARDEGIATPDRSVQLVDLPRVLRESEALLDGSHPSTTFRLAMLRAVQGALPL